MDVKETTFRKAALLLSAIGAQYAIVYDGKVHTSADCKFAMLGADGTLHGDLEAVKVKQYTRGPAKGPRVSWTETGYLQALKGMAVGSVWAHQCKDKKEAQGLQKVLAGQAGAMWGRGNMITTVSQEHLVEILRVA